MEEKEHRGTVRRRFEHFKGISPEDDAIPEKDRIDTSKNRSVKECLENALRLSELGWLLNNLQECVWIYDHEGKEKYSNAMARKLFDPEYDTHYTFTDKQGNHIDYENNPFKRAFRGEEFNYLEFTVESEYIKGDFVFKSALFYDQIYEDELLVVILTAVPSLTVKMVPPDDLGDELPY
jgi:hypothetical protein